MNQIELRELSSSFPESPSSLFDVIARRLEKDNRYREILPKEDEKNIRIRISGEGTLGNGLAHILVYLDHIQDHISEDSRRYIETIRRVLNYRKRFSGRQQ